MTGGPSPAWKPARSRVRSLLLAAVALLVQLVVVYAPSAGGAPAVPHLDKLVHAAVFALPVVFGLLARLPVVPVVAAMALHAPVSEVVQWTLLPQRSGDPWDAVADLVGVGLGVLAARAAAFRPQPGEAGVDRRAAGRW